MAGARGPEGGAYIDVGTIAFDANKNVYKMTGKPVVCCGGGKTIIQNPAVKSLLQAGASLDDLLSSVNRGCNTYCNPMTCDPQNVAMQVGADGQTAANQVKNINSLWDLIGAAQNGQPGTSGEQTERPMSSSDLSRPANYYGSEHYWTEGEMGDQS